MAGPYTREKDPFILYDLSRPSPVREYARHFYNATSQVCVLGPPPAHKNFAWPRAYPAPISPW
jgi:hypothetical protein